MKKIILISFTIIAGVGLALSTFATPPFSGRLDFVNIGSPASEAGHDLQGWGPVEPTTNGGNWGAITSESNCGLVNAADCDKLLRVTYAGNEPDHPQIVGRMATVTLKPQKKGWGLVRELKIRALDGVANDDFMVFIKNKNGNWENVYTYVSNPSVAEVWKIHEIPLGPKNWFKFNKQIEIAIMATGDTWAQHSTYGQLGIDWIELVGGPMIPNHNNNAGDNED
jgi:hypothetical protein